MKSKQKATRVSLSSYETAVQIAIDYTSDIDNPRKAQIAHAVHLLGGRTELKDAFLKIGMAVEKFMRLGRIKWDRELDFYCVTGDAVNLLQESLVIVSDPTRINFQAIAFSALFSDRDAYDDALAVKAKTLAENEFVALNEETKGLIAEGRLHPREAWLHEIDPTACNLEPSGPRLG